MRQVLLVAAALVLCSGTVWGQVAEKLDRGVVVMRQADGSCYVGWRLLESDPADVAFHVYRQAGPVVTPQTADCRAGAREHELRRRRSAAEEGPALLRATSDGRR